MKVRERLRTTQCRPLKKNEVGELAELQTGLYLRRAFILRTSVAVRKYDEEECALTRDCPPDNRCPCPMRARKTTLQSTHRQNHRVPSATLANRSLTAGRSEIPPVLPSVAGHVDQPSRATSMILRTVKRDSRWVLDPTSGSPRFTDIVRRVAGRWQP